jgi:hypothetical protein
MCVFVYRKVLTWQGSVGTTCDVIARVERVIRDLLQFLPVNNSHWKDKDSTKQNSFVLSVFHFNGERHVCESLRIYTLNTDVCKRYFVCDFVAVL